VSATPDVAVVGGGVVGCALAAFLAEAGARVRLYERERIGAGASGRNSGLLQHPLDPALVELFEESLVHYRELGHGFSLPHEPAGLMIVGTESEPLAAEHAVLAERFPELRAQWLDDAAEVEPALAPGLFASRLETGYPIPPAAATAAWAARAGAAGAEIREGAAAAAAVSSGRAEGVTVDGALEPAGAVVVAAGPSTREALGGFAIAPAIVPLWGAIAEVRLARPPVHTLEQAGAGSLSSGAAPAALFSIVTAGGASAVGSTFTPDPPDAGALAPELLARGARFVPALAHARAAAARACARPWSSDGRPLLGPVPGVEGLAVAAGHGAWGVTLAPGSARLVADALLGRRAEIPPALAVDRR
jgi:glycine/D-amino acid oxidase-like deaminating enzyme